MWDPLQMAPSADQIRMLRYHDWPPNQRAQKHFQIAFAIIIDIIDNISICANGCNPGDDEADGCEKCKRITFEFSIFIGQ